MIIKIKQFSQPDDRLIRIQSIIDKYNNDFKSYNLYLELFDDSKSKIKGVNWWFRGTKNTKNKLEFPLDNLYFDLTDIYPISKGEEPNYDNIEKEILRFFNEHIQSSNIFKNTLNFYNKLGNNEHFIYVAQQIVNLGVPTTFLKFLEACEKL